jgi:uncharacterized protein
MKYGKSRYYGAMAAAVLFIASSAAAAALDVPSLSGRINDRAGVLSASAAGDLENYLAAVEKSTGIQIALLTIPTLEGEVIESYSLKVAEKWGLGGAEADNGALLLVAMEEKKIRIEVGYGLEGVLTDAMSGYIIRETIVPEFKNGNFQGGIEAGLRAIGGVATGEAPISEELVSQSGSDGGESGRPFVFIIIFLLIFVFGRMGRYRRYRRRGMSPLGAFMLGSLLGGSNRSSGSSRGFGGGGFSGGGGGFGGGGASGGW